MPFETRETPGESGDLIFGNVDHLPFDALKMNLACMKL